MSPALKQLAEMQGNEIPEADVREDLQWIWRCFQRLNRDRDWISVGMGGAIPAPIRLRDVSLYADRFGYGDEAFNALDHCILAMDAWWLEDYHAKRPKPNPPPPQPTRR